MERTAIILGVLISLVPPGGDALAASGQTLNAPPIVIQGGTTEQIETVESVLDRFETTGLDLPPLSVYIHDTKNGCDGHSGLYSPRSQIDRIDICSDAAFIVLHELAHAWEHRFGTDVARQRLLDQFGLDDIAATDRNPRRRDGKVYIDYLQNGRGKLIVYPHQHGIVEPTETAG